ncbi:monocarboxylate transporter 3 [Sitodiplosis mosellana]|uniref:monocarboxylate transporter 3 n=1 Tax=Sitodiplosis mosellana TaxID=263140 RepID=UPI0024443D02|nr:monocarboxylate transporter 3 [Sitodiplosis mosellana]XP_055316719.1 monocarboxylate transporter 3 [Sitodiplosis mosellana]XP_055316720.1 monocarboxylate transporter 3 [Sitodiplosis mosellana]XP_055316721.1 monocarboxylate transporter 3 [Sitodiplosis mosellana]XP_055316722.1 monocarboxylate transporter 3 [Sitodiplosis mosellana]
MPLQDQTVENHPNGSLGVSEKLLKIPSQQINGKFTQKKVEEEEDEEVTPTADVVVPLDGGYGWVIVAASFICCLIVDGIAMNASIFNEELKQEFGLTDDTKVAFVASLLQGFYLIAGPFVSAMANRWGFRPITIAGAFVASAAFAVSSQADGLPFLYITFGLIGGIGFSMIYIPAVIIVGYYFERWRALATGIAMCGSGAGTFAIAPLATFLIDNCGWRHALLWLAMIILVTVLCGALFRPLESVQITLEEGDQPAEIKDVEKPSLPVVFTKPLAEGRYAFSVPNSSHNTWIGASSNTRYPTAAEVFRGSGANLDRRTSITPSATPTVTSATTQLNAGNIHHTTKKLEQLSKAQQKRSGNATPTDETAPAAPQFNLHKELNTVGEDDENESEALIEDGAKPQLTARRHTVSGRRPNILANGTAKKERRSAHQHLGSSNRPLYRDDIFFSGSLVRIPGYQSQTSLQYHMTVTRMPTQNDVEEEENATCKICPEAVRRTLATMLDMSLLKSPSFMLLAVSGFLCMMGFFVPFAYVYKRGVAAELDDGVAKSLVPAIGIANTVARVVCGFLSSLPNVDANLLSNIAITSGGVATIISGISITAGFQFTYTIIFGLAIACFSALRSIIAVDLMGIEKLTNAFGILMLFQGLAAIIGGPIAGALYTATKNYDYAFYFSGALITLSAILCYPIKAVNRWEKKSAQETSKVSPAV